MKLRNKKTGRIIELNNIDAEEGPITSLAELNAEWEDYEEPKYFFYITADGYIRKEKNNDNIRIGFAKEIGNYFETEEEAEKAVEKLKAWKRLKDIGFKFIGKSYEYKVEKNFGSVFFETGSHEKIMKVYEDNVDFYDDIDTIFRGEE